MMPHRLHPCCSHVGRSVAATDGLVIAAGKLGKYKTAIQMFSIPAIMVNQPFLGIPWGDLGYWGLWVSVVLSVASGVQYTAGYFKEAKVQL